jgi:uncharacterized repeat protein (TIGR02543 family)
MSDIVGNLSKVTYSCFMEAVGNTGDSHNLRANPRFVSAADKNPLTWDLRLTADSPCIDAGIVATQNLSSTDLAGNPRPGGDKLVDMGAYESPDAYTPGTPSSPTVTLYVSPNGDGSTGQDWGHALKTIASALEVVQTNDDFYEIRVAAGTYREDREIRLPGRVNLMGGWSGNISNPDERDTAAYKTVIDGEKTYRCIWNHGLLNGLWIQNGSVDGSGGGVYNDDTGTVTNCTMTGNSASGYGGGICNNGGAVDNCTMTVNSANGSGGGIYNTNGVTISNCIISGNSATYGGGIYNSESCTVINCTVTGNTSSDSCGGIDNDGTVSDCVVTGNSTRWAGGGISNDGMVINCIIRENSSSSGSGGGIDNGYDSVVANCVITGNTSNEGGGINNKGTLVQCTVVGNSATDGGGVHSYAGTVTNCIAWGNSVSDIGGDLSKVTYCNFFEATGENHNLWANPKFVSMTGDDPSSWDLSLQADSLCIDSGTMAVSNLPTTDILGVPRPQGKGMDRGAYEFTNTFQVVVVADPANGGTVSKSPDQVLYENGTVVTLTATAAEGYTFTGWYEGTTKVSAENSFTHTVASTNKRFTAKFAQDVPKYAVTVVADPTAGGTVSKNPDQATYASGAQVIVTATVTDGYTFTGWYDGDTKVSSNVSYTYTVAAEKTFTAKFTQVPTYAVSVIADPTAGGTVSKNPDQATYASGAQVIVTATVTDGYTFTGWYDGDAKVSSNVSYTYTVAAEKTFTAKFTQVVTCTVAVVADPSAGGTVSKSPNQATYASGTQVILTAEAAEGYTFTGWYDGAAKVSSNASYTYTVAANKTFTAKFTQVVTCTVAVVADPSAGGTVSKSPNQATYVSGSQVTLAATAADGYQFTGWYDGTTQISSNATYLYTVTENKTFTAKFEVAQPDQFSVNVVANPIAGGTVSKSPDQATYASGTQVILTAEAAEGYAFTGWYDGATKVSSNASYTYTVAAEKTFTAKFSQVATYTVSVAADPAEGGTVSKSPDQATYASGDQVILTATPAGDYLFVGWYDGNLKVSSSASYTCTVSANKTFTAKFATNNLPAPQNVRGQDKTYWALLTWQAVSGAEGYRITRTAGGQAVAWDTNAAPQFSDDTVVPGVEYSYQVAALNALGAPGASSAVRTISVTAETFRRASYKVTAKGYTLTRDQANNLSFTGESAGTIKIAVQKNLLRNVEDDPAKGIYYLLNVDLIPTLTVNGDVKTLAIEVPVSSLEVTGMVNTLQAKNGINAIRMGEVGSVKLAATRPMESGQYTRTSIMTNGSVPLSLQATGVVIENIGSSGNADQPIKLLNVASKSYRNEVGLSRTSLGAIGNLPRVVADLAGTPAPAMNTSSPSAIRGSMLKTVTVSGGSIVADELVGAIDKVTVAGGNLRCGLIRSSKDLALLQATAKKVNGKPVGGAVGTAGNATAMFVEAQPNAKNCAIGKVYGQVGVSGYFYAGYDADLDAPTMTGGINLLQAKTGEVEGAAFLDPALAPKLKVLPKMPTQPIEINPDR